MIARQAFTLIELLIVVAIIGILAAIAVPNLMNAQIKAQVSRVVSDHKTLAVAIETYRIDKGQPPHSPIYGGMFVYDFARRYIPLTTPIPYIQSIPDDPFPHHSTRELDTSMDMKHIVPGNHTYGYFRADTSGPGGQYNFGFHKWMLTSSGPDGLLEYFAYYPQSETEGKELCAVCNIQTPSILLVAIQYDPSNGIKSGGDILHWNTR
jgi:type II secretion system protein G